MQEDITCGKCGQHITQENVTWQGFHRVGQKGFMRTFFTCPNCKRRGQVLLKVHETDARFPSQP